VGEEKVLLAEDIFNEIVLMDMLLNWLHKYHLVHGNNYMFMLMLPIWGFSSAGENSLD